MAGTSYYDQNRDRLFDQYSAVSADAIHGIWARKALRDREPGTACDIGAGSGRDANWLAEIGWEVIAVEPSKLRLLAEQRSHSRVTWLDDSLPGLKKLRALGHRFDLILLNGIWQHIASKQRGRAFRILCEMLNPSGLLAISLRHGDNETERLERGFFSVNSDELIQLANQHAISHRGSYRNQLDLSRKHIRWDWQIFEMPDDVTGNLPLLRHIIVNDNKSSSYKLGLLRTLVKLAETAPGLVTKRTDDYVEIPFGAVGLYWIRLFQPLILDRKLRQSPGSGGYGFAREAFYKLADISPNDLSLGYRFDDDRANIVRTAIADACKNIKRMPAHFITYPGDSNRNVFECDYEGVKKRPGSIVLSKEYLSGFGTFRVPSLLWQTLGQFSCWLDPAIVREWRQLILPWQSAGQFVAADDHAFEWAQSVRETTAVASRAQEMREAGFPLECIWSATRLGRRSRLEIDHCFPWSRWPNNDLWNLLPTRAAINQDKSDRLPTAETLEEAHERIVDWWRKAWIDTPKEEQFFLEAGYSLPGLSSERPTLDEIHTATHHQRRRLKQDQQIPEWLYLNQALKNLDQRP